MEEIIHSRGSVEKCNFDDNAARAVCCRSSPKCRFPSAKASSPQVTQCHRQQIGAGNSHNAALALTPPRTTSSSPTANHDRLIGHKKEESKIGKPAADSDNASGAQVLKGVGSVRATSAGVELTVLSETPKRPHTLPQLPVMPAHSVHCPVKTESTRPLLIGPGSPWELSAPAPAL